jgi:dynein light intermediate chain 1, cytosolic
MCFHVYAIDLTDNPLQPTPFPPFNSPTPEQAFLAKNYDENAKKPDRDPRGAFRNPADLTAAAAGIVGPLGSSSFNLPTVERALTDMEIGIGGGAAAANPEHSRRLTRNSAGLVPVGTTVPPGRGPGSPTPAAASPSPTSGQTQHEVLQNFFQSLLSSKDRAGVSAVASSSRTSAVPQPNGSSVEEGSG